MAFLWSGSVNASSIVNPNHSQVIDEIMWGLDTAGTPESEVYTPSMDIELMGNFLSVKAGRPGTYEAFKDFEGFFQDDAEYVDPEEYKETYAKWDFKRKGFSIKNGSYDRKTFKNAIENGDNIDELVADRTASLISKYEKNVIPNALFEEVLRVPTSGGTFYEKFGAVRDTTVSPNKLISYDPTATAGTLESNVRNNWRAIAENSGLSLEDIKFVKEYMGNVEGIDEENLLVFGGSNAISEAGALFDVNMKTREEIVLDGTPTGLQAWTVEGLSMISTKSLPKNILMFVNPDARNIVTQLISDKPEFQGLYMETARDGEKFIANGESLMGSKLIIGEFGNHMVGRLDVLFLDIDATRFNADREMQAGGFEAVTKKAKSLRGKWYKNVNELK